VPENADAEREQQRAENGVVDFHLAMPTVFITLPMSASLFAMYFAKSS
jgi:hypothetical protein